MKKETESGSKYKVPNLERGLFVLELLINYPDGLSQSDIAKNLGCSKSSIYRITMTLLEHGYLVRDPDTKLFKVSRKMLAIGCKGLADVNLLDNSLDVMRKLRDEIKETVLIGTLIESEGVVLEQILGTHPFKFSVDIGARLPLHCAAPGKAMLAFLPDSECKQIIKNIDFVKFNSNTIVDPKEFKKELVEVKKCGYALDRGEQLTGIHCISAPILGRFGYPVAAIWTTGPTDRILKSSFKDLGKLVKEHAMVISKRLGYELV